MKIKYIAKLIICIIVLLCIYSDVFINILSIYTTIYFLYDILRCLFIIKKKTSVFIFVYVHHLVSIILIYLAYSNNLKKYIPLFLSVEISSFFDDINFGIHYTLLRYVRIYISIFWRIFYMQKLIYDILLCTIDIKIYSKLFLISIGLMQFGWLYYMKKYTDKLD